MTGPFSAILVPTDGSDDAKLATQVATDLAKRTGAAIHLAHAWQIATYAGDPFIYSTALPDDYLTMYEQTGRAILENEAARIAADGVTVAQTHLLQGRPADVIVELGRAIGADLIIVGSRGLGPIRRLVLGSVSDGIAHNAPCPVLVVRGDATAWPPQYVVVGDDGSDTADRATQVAAQLVKLYAARGAVVRAYQPVLVLDREDLHAAQRRDEMIEEAEVALGKRAAALTEAFGTRPEARLAIDDPAALLVATAEGREEPALIVVGTRGLGAFQRFRLGSTSTKVLHAAHCPVLIVPGKREGTGDEGAK